MIDFVQTIGNIADKYGLKLPALDSTDVTVMARIEIVPGIIIQAYRNIEKNKINLALISGNNRIYGIDSEGDLLHEHPVENPLDHVFLDKRPDIEGFILTCLELLHKWEIL